MSDGRLFKLIVQAKEVFQLDLSDLVVLTEAASGWFCVTPLIAALGGAKEVIAVGKDSRHGTLLRNKEHILDLAHRWGCADRIRIVQDKKRSDIAQADVVTNLGFVRPIDADMVSLMKPTAAVPLMWEPWEYRSEDLDLEACEKAGIPVLGTNEQCSRLRTFDYVGMVALKMLLEADIEGLMSHVVVLGSGHFGLAVVKKLKAIGADVVWINPYSTACDKESHIVSVPVWPDLNHQKTRQFLSTADALIVVEHHSAEQVLGPCGMLDFDELKDINEALVIVHICGNIDTKSLYASNLQCKTEIIQEGHRMSVTTAYVGPRPVIDLHTAGLRVGEILTRSRLEGATVQEAKERTLAGGLAKDFCEKSLGQLSEENSGRMDF